jgi:putative membrane protein insertion efficiency factor
VKRLISALLIAPIRLYQRFISPAFAPRCRYYPTCSEYAVQSIRELGPIRGALLAGWRLLRCNPFSHGGVDEVSDRRFFRGGKTRSERHQHPRQPPQEPHPNYALPTPGGSNRADLT